MWGTIANLKENLNKIALDVHDGDDDEILLRMYGGSTTNGDHNSAVSDRRNSNGFAHSKSPLANGIDHSEVEQYKAEIKRLQASEAEIKALSVNYAALLKEKEDQIVRLNKENGSLKQNMEATNAALRVSKAEGSIASTNGTYSVKGSDQSPYRQNKITTQSKMEFKHSNLQGKDKEIANLVDGNNGPTVDAYHRTEIQKLKLELELEHDQLTKIQLKFQEEQKLNKSFQEELKILKLERDKTSKVVSEVRNELNEKVSEIKRLQLELARRENEEAVEAVDNLKRLIKTLEKENTNLKMEKKEVEAALESSRKPFTDKMLSNASEIQNNDSSRTSDMPDPSQSFPGKEEMERSIQKLSKDLMETQRERDKVVQELTRLKQHLLEKESEESEKMDEDSKIIEELRDSNDYLRAQISHIERTLKQTIASRDELKMANSNEILKSREVIDDLNKKVTNCISTIDAKNIELLNLQTALGQYYAEIEAKEHLEGEFARAREETAKLSQLLKDADHKADVSKREKEEILVKLSQSEKAQTEWRSRVSKLEEDNAKLRRAVEQSMTRLNRMSVDSDYLVDRRIVIKLLVTYFQRNHNREVLDLMVRMLGFSDEDKQRIGGAQQGAGKGVVRGVLGLPGRLVGGMLGGGGSTEAAANTGSDNQSFADLWVDFLLKETEEREKRESTTNTGKSTEDSRDKSPNTISASPPSSNQRFSIGAASAFPITSTNQNTSPPPHSHFQHSEHFGSEFSTVPLADGKTTGSNLFPRY
ncbi:PREDICTED: golgin candidate 3-like isoform X2 [Lupinus angustifolius]|uniref:golgin candidate 3-like isoform X2 n=1 Tax=Lupinus angustifolius TaxID=3871 RepID=UPI00092F3D42|nr:PREDICTED: golgin candidate 3-like isoform X2 [Lupinus angustifolius]